MFGINGAEFVVILVVGALVVGPEGVVRALRTFRRAVDSLRSWSASLRESTRPGAASSPLTDLTEYDLTEYDPRKVVRRAVHEEMAAWMRAASPPSSGPTHSPHPAPAGPPRPTPAAPAPGARPQEDQ